jgi:hypothetical protein
MIEDERLACSSDAASNFAVDRTAGSRSLAAAGHRGRYPVVRLCLASLSAHVESAPGQFMVGLR